MAERKANNWINSLNFMKMRIWWESIKISILSDVVLMKGLNDRRATEYEFNGKKQKDFVFQLNFECLQSARLRLMATWFSPKLIGI